MYISACIYMIATKFLRLYTYVFDVKQHNWTDLKLTLPCVGVSKQSKIAISAAVNSTSSKQTQQRQICFQRWFTPFDSMVTLFIKFSPKNHSPHLQFRWRNSITGWTISKIATSLHHVLMALWIRWSRYVKFRRAAEIFKKNEVVQLLHPRCSRVNAIYMFYFDRF